MAYQLNEWRGIGNIGRDPEVRQLPNGGEVVSFSIACNYTTGSGDNRKENTDWVPISYFPRDNDKLVQFLKAGVEVMVRGRLQQRQYEQNGEKRTSYQIRADRIDLGPRKNNDGDGPSRSRTAATNATSDLDDIPF